MMRTGSGRSLVNKARGQTSRRNKIAKSQSASAHICTGRVIWSSDFSTRSSIVGALQLDMTNLRPTIWPSSSSHPFGFGYAFMSSRPLIIITESSIERAYKSRLQCVQTAHRVCVQTAHGGCAYRRTRVSLSHQLPRLSPSPPPIERKIGCENSITTGPAALSLFALLFIGQDRYRSRRVPFPLALTSRIDLDHTGGRKHAEGPAFDIP